MLVSNRCDTESYGINVMKLLPPMNVVVNKRCGGGRKWVIWDVNVFEKDLLL